MVRRFPIYTRLLGLYPKPYRQKYTRQMTQTLADMLDDAPSGAARKSVWLRTAIDLPVSLTRQHILYLGEGLTHAPGYVRRNSLIGLALLAPFFVLVTANSILDRRLFTSFFWHVWVLFAWIIVLPGMAFILSGITGLITKTGCC